MPYYVRDLLGHFSKPEDEMQMCPHKCCRGYRVHPERLPVRFDRVALRRMSEPELIRHLTKYQHFTEERQGAYRQIIAEFDRRDAAERARQRRRKLYRNRDQEYRDEVYRQAINAEAQTNGYMLNREGQRAGVDPVSLFTGPESRVRKYASPELISYFETHGRPTRVSWFGSARQRREYRAGSRVYAVA